MTYSKTYSAPPKNRYAYSSLLDQGIADLNALKAKSTLSDASEKFRALSDARRAMLQGSGEVNTCGDTIDQWLDEDFSTEVSFYRDNWERMDVYEFRENR